VKAKAEAKAKARARAKAKALAANDANERIHANKKNREIGSSGDLVIGKFEVIILF
jgi:hypothetical protein